MRTRHTFVATGLVALLALAGVTAAIAADPAGPPPPRIAFLANGIVPADALAAGPIAGQLGAPVFTTQPDTLSGPAAEGLDSADPELVIVLGGPVAVSDAVVNQAAAVTGLAVVADPHSRPDSGIVRAAGQDRFETAKIVAQLLGDYDPAYLGVDLMAVDADLLDGKDSSAFQPAGDYALADQACATGQVVTGIAADGTPTCATDKVGSFDGDADTLDGLDSTAFAPASLDAFVPVATFIVDDAGTLRGSQWRAPLSGAPVVDASGAASGLYLVDLPGLSLSFFGDTVICTRAETGPGTIHHEVVGGDLRLWTTDVAGTGEGSWFHCAVHDG